MEFPAHSRKPSPLRLRWRRLARTVALAIPFGRFLVPGSTPLMLFRQIQGAGAPSSALLVFLSVHQDECDVSFQTLLDQAWVAGLHADAVEVDLHLGSYLRPLMIARLREEVIKAARAEGYTQVWLVGVSLGGAGALAYAREYPDDVDGVVLLAPHLGHRRFAEGLRAPRTDYVAPGPQEFQHELWEWLSGPAAKPPIYLGFGTEDRHSACHRLMAELLPKGRVFVAPGGHDWTTWTRLWTSIATRIFTHPRHWA